MKRIRNIKGAIKEIKAEQPDFALSEYALRRLCVTGEFPCQRLRGKTYLVDMDLLDETGVFLLSDILMGYFPDDDMLYLYRRLSVENKYGRSKHEFTHLLHGKSKKELKELLSEIEKKEVSMDPIEGKEYYIKVLRDEIGRRLPHPTRACARRLQVFRVWRCGVSSEGV